MERTVAPAHPGRILRKHYVEPLHLSQVYLAKTLGVSRKTVNKLICERGAVTPDMALRLSQAFATTPELWLNLQRNYDLWQAQQEQPWRQVHVLPELQAAMA